MNIKEDFLKAFHRVLGATMKAQRANAECTKALAELGDAWRDWFTVFEAMGAPPVNSVTGVSAPSWLIDWADDIDNKGGEE